MVIYVISAIVIISIVLNWFLGEKLYEMPRDKGFFDNVTSVNLSKERNIAADPRYVVKISVLTGIFLGLYLAYASVEKIGGLLVTFVTLAIFVCYLIELTRKITIKDGKLILSKFLSSSKEIEPHKIKGIYIYSYNKKFLKQHAYTTKLVIVMYDDKMIKFSLSSLDNKSVLNMIKEVFGVTRNKMFISKRNEKA